MRTFNKETILDCMARLSKAFPHLNSYPHCYKNDAKPQYNRNIFDEITALYDKLAFPEHPNWSYCIPILANVKFMNGEVLDLGIHIQENNIVKQRAMDKPTIGIRRLMSCNLVHSNDGPDYASGELTPYNHATKKLMVRLHQLGILTDEDMRDALVTGELVTQFYRSSEATYWDLRDLINSKTFE